MDKTYEFVADKPGSQTVTLLLDKPGTVTVRALLMHPGAELAIRIMHTNSSLTLITQQLHTAPHCTSSVTVKGVLYDHQVLDYSGKIYVAATAHNTHAEQKSHTLLLGEHAYAQAIPALEVLTHDVQCKHGSAVSELSALHLEYCAARGISAEQAQQLLIDAFMRAD